MPSCPVRSTPTWSGISTSPKAPPEDVARATLDGVERGEEEIFPDPMSRSLGDGWRAGVAKALERQNAAMVLSAPIAA